MVEKNELTLSKHIAGIIPVSKVQSDIDLIIHPSMLPIANNFYAIQRSIVECSYMGCKTIWIICDESVAPLIKSVCGDFVLNLAQHERAKFAKFPQENRTSIPIFYVPLSYKNMNKTGIGATIVDGVSACFTVSDKISKWITPYRYYVSMPYGIYNPRVTKTRSLVKENESFFYTYKGKSARSGNYIGFSFSARQFKHCSYLFKRINVKSNYTLDLVFGDDIMSENSCSIELDNYVDISSWSDYQNMMCDPLRIESDWRYCFSAAMKK